MSIVNGLPVVAFMARAPVMLMWSLNVPGGAPLIASWSIDVYSKKYLPNPPQVSDPVESRPTLLPGTIAPPGARAEVPAARVTDPEMDPDPPMPAPGLTSSAPVP